MSKEKFAFDKTNFILLAVAMAVVIIGFILMTGPVSTPTHFEPDIFSARRIKVGFIESKFLFTHLFIYDLIIYGLTSFKTFLIFPFMYSSD